MRGESFRLCVRRVLVCPILMMGIHAASALAGQVEVTPASMNGW